MLSRNYQPFRIISNRCIGLLNSKTNNLHVSKQYPFILTDIRPSSNSSISSSSASIDDFTNVIDTLFSKEEVATHSYAEKLKNVTTVDVLKEFCIDSRPSTPQEAFLILQRLVKLANSEKQKDFISAFVRSEAYVSSLSAQLLNDEVDLSCLLEAGTCILTLLKSLPKSKPVVVDEDTPLKLTPTFDSFFLAFMENIKKKISSDEIAQLDSDIVVAFFRSLQDKDYAELDASFVNEYKKLLQRKIPEITSTATVTTLLTSLKKAQYEDEPFILLVLSKVEELAPNMLLGELVNAFTTLSENNYRKIQVLQVISEAIRNHLDVLTLHQLERLALGITKLSFYNPRLITRYCADLIQSVESIQKLSQVSSILMFLSRARVTDEKVWKKLIDWINENHRNANISDLRMCIGSLAHMNVNPSFCKPVLSYLTLKLQPSFKEDPQKWLNTVYALTCLKALTPKLAESVLREEFQKEVLAKIADEAAKIFTLQKLCQINASAKFELNGYRGNLANFNDFKFEVNLIFGKLTKFNESMFEPTICENLKYGKNIEKLEKFRKIVKTPIPPVYVTPPAYYPEFGVYMDSLVNFNPKTSKFIALPSQPKDPKLPLKGLIAVQYFNEKHYTASFTNDDNRRLLGGYQMGIRLLEAVGAKVVVISEHDLEKQEALVDRICFVNEKIKQAATADNSSE